MRPYRGRSGCAGSRRFSWRNEAAGSRSRDRARPRRPRPPRRFEVQTPASGRPRGSGLDGGETHAEAIVRELTEEAGLEDVELGPWIWTLTRHPVCRRPLGRAGPSATCSCERRLRAGASLHAERLAAEFVTGIRWWTPEELAASDELFAPRRLPELIAALLRDGPPGSLWTSVSSATPPRRTVRARPPSPPRSCRGRSDPLLDQPRCSETDARTRPLG